MDGSQSPYRPDRHPSESYEDILNRDTRPIPEHLRLVIANSMVKHSVADGGEYALRRREVEEAAAAIAVGLRQTNHLGGGRQEYGRQLAAVTNQ